MTDTLTIILSVASGAASAGAFCVIVAVKIRGSIATKEDLRAERLEREKLEEKEEERWEHRALRDEALSASLSQIREQLAIANALREADQRSRDRGRQS